MRRGVLFAFVGVVICGSLVAAFVLFRNKDVADGQPVAVVAGDTPRADLPKATRPHEPYPFKRVVLVSIGINHYPKLRGTTDLRFAAADAAEVADVCESLYGYEVVRLSAHVLCVDT
eukprot:Opistho-1_new@40448